MLNLPPPPPCHARDGLLVLGVLLGEPVGEVVLQGEEVVVLEYNRGYVHLHEANLD